MANELYPMAQPAQQNYQMPQVTLPKLTSLQDVIGTGQPTADPGNIYKLLQAPQGRATDILPSLQELLMSQQAPAVQSIRQGAQATAAKMQSEAMKRGITGSDIELANMRGAYAQGEQQVGQLIGQQASTLAQYIMQAYGMDIQSNREMFVTLAQALGQQMQMEQDWRIAQMEAVLASDAAKRSSRNSLLGSVIGAGGAIVGGFLAGRGGSSGEGSSSGGGGGDGGGGGGG